MIIPKSGTCLQWGRRGFDPWVRKIPWRRAWQPTPVFLPGESMDRGAWQATVHRVARVGHSWVAFTTCTFGLVSPFWSFFPKGSLTFDLPSVSHSSLTLSPFTYQKSLDILHITYKIKIPLILQSLKWPPLPLHFVFFSLFNLWEKNLLQSLSDSSFLSHVQGLSGSKMLHLPRWLRW